MKAYKLIWKLLRHPFAKVSMSGTNDYKIAGVSYCEYLNEYLLLPPLSSIRDLSCTLEPTISGCCDDCEGKL